MKSLPPPHDVEAEFADVIDTLKLDDFSLRKERRAVVLAAFEQACAGANRQRGERFIWAYATGLAAAIAALAFASYNFLAPKPNSSVGGNSGTASAGAATSHAQAEPPALRELNVTLAIANARAAAAEQELAWLTAMRDEAGWEKRRFGPQQRDPLNQQP